MIRRTRGGRVIQRTEKFRSITSFSPPFALCSLYSGHTTFRPIYTPSVLALLYTYKRNWLNGKQYSTARFYTKRYTFKPTLSYGDTRQRHGFHLHEKAFPPAGAPCDATTLPIPQAPLSPLFAPLVSSSRHIGVEAGTVQNNVVRCWHRGLSRSRALMYIY